MLTQNLTKSENTYAAAKRRASIASGWASVAAANERAKPRAKRGLDELSWREQDEAAYEKESRQESAAAAAKIQRACARNSEGNMAMMRAESAMLRPKAKPTTKRSTKAAPWWSKAAPKSTGYRRKV